jgi:O-antigen ligase
MNAAELRTRVEPSASLSPVRWVLALLLWGVFAIKASPIFMLGLGLGLLLILVYLAEGGGIDAINIVIVSNVTYWLLSGFLIGGLTVGMLAQVSYYSNEGRIFLCYIPFIIMTCSCISRATLRMTIKQLVYMAVLGLGMYAVWAVKKPALLSVGRAHNFAGLMTSHTGSGTFFSELCVFLMIYGNRARSRTHFLLGMSMVLPVLGSGSRESLVALFAVLAWFMRSQISPKTVLLATALVGGLATAMPTISPHTYDRVAQMFDPQTLKDIQAQVVSGSAANWEPGQDKDLSGEEFNILSRILYWSYAIKRFVDSPFFGDGFGRFNDRYVHFDGIPGLYYFGVEAINSPATLHAHNSYLMMLAETGLVGLLLLLSIWYLMWKRITAARREFADDPELSGFFQALQGVIVFVLFAALFGHALGAPTDAVPALTLLGLGISFYRTHRRGSGVADGLSPPKF